MNPGVCLILCLGGLAAEPIETVFKWTRLSYDLGGLEGLSSERQESVRADYDWSKNALGAVRHYKDKLYLSVPRWKDGVPSTLNAIDLTSNVGVTLSPLLSPFPNIFKNEIGLCSALQNVVALEVTPQGQLWVADSGSAAIFTNPIRKCPAKIMVFDLEAGNAELFSYEFPESVVATKRNAVLMHMVLDYTRRAHDFPASEADSLQSLESHRFRGLTVYLSDIHSGSLVVFDVENRRSWSLSLAEMRPSHVTMMFQEDSVILRFGITGIALESKAAAPERTRLFFGTLKKDLYALPVIHLHNSSLSPVEELQKHVVNIGTRNSASDGITSDDQGTLFYGLLENGAIMQWNTTQEPFYHKREKILSNVHELEWVNSLSVDNGYLWIVSNRQFTWLELDATEPNFKIFRYQLPKVGGGKGPARISRSYIQEYVSDAPVLSSRLALLILPCIRALLQQIQP
eukprot:maker-scaffold212_size255419-snap-gene-1.31 protein:Tk00548 transcript:maker-scaffold212_size255419-snap-gene-1.31-mRNA-1 annotation:"yellow-x1c precursor"